MGNQPLAVDLPELLEYPEGPSEYRLVAPESARMRALNIHKKDSVPELSMRILEVVARSKERGIMQSDIAIEVALDNKSVFHYMKPLRALQLVNILPVALKVGRSGRSNLVRLSRFAGSGEAGPEECERFRLKDDLSGMEALVLAALGAAPDYILPETDCKRAMGSVKGNRMHHVWERLRAG
eukprot:CAMPEP_0113707560 /NCGR_PEP_ID=MMETSP0038_2-20120614/28470_1 /TAXON_ID=2898 /ORGANISM="Cryptomonas paramecium" /LENGTH=181 /DNA_ID=CAMNT_0000633121 /DNA_START=189 /DNA_END=730 /DNA_ORIENTATION=+ /assembly_acc=CAM_ASM_000170